MSDFRKEDRYRVFKLSDIEAAKQRHPRKADDIEEALLLLNYATSLARYSAEKEPLTCCVVESDWRCYDEVWALVEAEHGDESNDRTNLDMAAEIEVRDRRIKELEEELEEAWKPNRCRDAIAAHNRRGNKT